MANTQKHPLNRILFGPPGTGKTWTTIRLAVEICHGSAPSDPGELMGSYNELVRTRRIAFTTFHQSIGYEEFVEGLRPFTESDDDDQSSAGFRLEPRNGIFREICAEAEQARKRGRKQGKFDFKDRQFFKMSLGRARTERPIYDAAIKGSYIVLGWGEDVDWSDAKYDDYQAVVDRWHEKEPSASRKSGNISQIWAFRSLMKKGDIVIVSEGNLRFRAIGEVTGGYQFQPQEPQDDAGNHRRAVKWLAVLDESLPIEVIHDGNLSQASCYRLTPSRMKLDALAEQIATEPDGSSSTPEPFVLIIDEINRANVSKVLGELITLLEPDKRLGASNALTVKLPYSNDEFGVPNNLYVIGTMNTADRSIALLDTALRRRFDFMEMMPDYTCLDKEVGGIHLGRLLSAINRRVEWLFDRDHQIGHSYFINIENKADLDQVMRAKIIPLLAEYFYEDWEKVRATLNDDGDWFIGIDKLSAPPMLKSEGEERLRYSIKRGDIPIEGYIKAAR
jgi:5-methylcytosine-specific restriction protein B